MRPSLLTAIAGMAIACSATAGECTEVFWANPSGGAWGQPSNWTGGSGIPTADNVAVFNIAFDYDVTFVSNVGACGLSVRRGDITFDLAPFSLVAAGAVEIGTLAAGPTTAVIDGGMLNAQTLTMGSVAGANGTLQLISGADLVVEGDSRIGTTGAATVTAADESSVETVNAQLAVSAGSSGTLTLDGPDAEWLDTGLLVRIGDRGAGAATLASGAAATLPVVFVGANSGATGALTLTGASELTSSDEITIGGSGAADLVMQGGSSVAGTSVYFGRSGPGEGDADIDGSTLIATTNLVIGGDGDAQVQLSNGAEASASLAVIASGSASVAGITLDDASLDCSAQIQVGRLGDATLTAHSGASITSSGATSSTMTSAVIGWLSGSDGLATLTGAQTLWSCQNGSLVVGFSGRGELRVSSGARITSVGGFVGRNPGGDGLVIVSGSSSQWNAGAGVITLGQGPSGAAGGAGSVYANDSAVVSAQSVVVGSGGVLGGSAGAFQAPVVSAGVVSPGPHNPAGARGAALDPAAGLLTLGADYDQAPAGTLRIEIGGATPFVQHDRLVVQGAATLAGTLEVALFDGYDPPAGAEFLILDASSLDGQFSTESLPPLDGGRAWQVIYGDDSVSLRVIGEGGDCPGDVTGDQIVDFADLNALLVSFGQSGPNLPADLDGDGTVGFSDLNAVLVAFGTNCLR